mgnify:CR=1 FL=1
MSGEREGEGGEGGRTAAEGRVGENDHAELFGGGEDAVLLHVERPGRVFEQG